MKHFETNDHDRYDSAIACNCYFVHVCLVCLLSGMDMPFAPLSANIVCWNNQMTIENEELRRIECSQRLPKGLPSGDSSDSSDTVFSNETDLPTICQQPSKDTACCRQELVINEELVISGWNVADGYLPPTVPLTQLLWKGQRKKQNLQSSKASRTFSQEHLRCFATLLNAKS